ncbi:hypothetical protein KI387_031718, partial [Taxus chinensis]
WKQGLSKEAGKFISRLVNCLRSIKVQGNNRVFISLSVSSSFSRVFFSYNKSEREHECLDGIAPVRSSKQEQVHNSTVSTLLVIMDGLDSR